MHHLPTLSRSCHPVRGWPASSASRSPHARRSSPTRAAVTALSRERLSRALSRDNPRNRSRVYMIIPVRWTPPEQCSTTRAPSATRRASLSTWSRSSPSRSDVGGTPLNSGSQIHTRPAPLAALPSCVASASARRRDQVRYPACPELRQGLELWTAHQTHGTAADLQEHRDAGSGDVLLVGHRSAVYRVDAQVGSR